MDYDLKIKYQSNYVKSSSNTKFWGLIINDSIVEGSHKPNDIQTEYSMFFNLNDTSCNVSRNFKNGVFCIHPYIQL